MKSKQYLDYWEKEMNQVTVRNITFGEGRPKICVPITGRTREEIALRTGQLLDAKPDLAEWRADWYEEVKNREKLEETLVWLREMLGEMPLLVTFRTKEEGGEQEISPEDYENFLRTVLESGQADLIDVELFRGEDLLQRIGKEAGERGVRVLASSHDFEKTPEKNEIIGRLQKMQDLGADLLKIAVMPRKAEDVLTLLSATLEMKERYARQPVITMSMGAKGVISRLSGELFGSAMTFGFAGEASAPGQVSTAELKAALELMRQE